MISANTPLKLSYLALPHGLAGRGGVVRFFLLSQNIPFDEILFAMTAEEWGKEKIRLVESGENPSGTVPIVYAGSNPEEASACLLQHIAASRYLARVHKVTSGDDYKDYVQDLIADEYQGFRDHWVKTAFGEPTDEEKESYSHKDLPIQLTKFNALYGRFKTHDTFLSVSAKTGQPLWGDAAIFGLLRDHVLTGFLTLEDLEMKYPLLANMFVAYKAIPAVSAWIEAKQSEQAEAP